MNADGVAGERGRGIQTLGDRGFAVFRGVVAADALARLDTISTAGLAEKARRARCSIDELHRLCSAWSGECEFVQSLVDIAAPPLAELVVGVADAEPQHLDATLFVQSATGGGPTHAHQDIAYKWNRKVSKRYAMTSWLALDYCGEERGGLVFGGTFEPGAVAQRQDFLARDFIDLATRPEWRETAVCVEAEPGDVVVFDSRVWHAAAPFREDGRRRALALRWPSRTKWEFDVDIPAPPADRTVFGMDTSGQLFINAAKRIISDSAADGKPVEVAKHLERWLRESGEVLPLPAMEALRCLSLSLTLYHEQGGRPHAQVWLDVRDQLIPALESRAFGSAVSEKPR